MSTTVVHLEESLIRVNSAVVFSSLIISGLLGTEELSVWQRCDALCVLKLAPHNCIVLSAMLWSVMA